MAKNAKCTGREETSEKRHIKFVSFQICVLTNLSAPIAALFLLFLGEVYKLQQLNFERQKLLAGK
jgi:hypothetical protein